MKDPGDRGGFSDPAGGVQFHGELGLLGGVGRLAALQLPDAVDQRRLTGNRVDVHGFIEHIGDATTTHRQVEKSQLSA